MRIWFKAAVAAVLAASVTAGQARAQSPAGPAGYGYGIVQDEEGIPPVLEPIEDGQPDEMHVGPYDPYEHFDCQCCFAPTWSVRAGAVILKRESPRSAPLLQTALGAELLNAGDFNFNWAGGVDVSVFRHLNECTDIEFRFFGTDAWSASQTGGPALTTQFPVTPPVTNVGVATFASHYRSELWSTEFNLRRHTEYGVAMLAGFRYVELNEDLQTSVNLPLSQALHVVDVDNRLYGIQIGADGNLWEAPSGRFRLEGMAKAGLYYNSADQFSRIDRPENVTIAGPLEGRKSWTSFLGEMSFTGVYQVNHRLAVRAGYQLMWIEGVALASEQVAVSNFVTDSGITTTGGVFYHGALLGAEFSW